MNRSRVLIVAALLIVLAAGGALWAKYGVGVLIRGFAYICA
jgi:hypothetical protein